MAAAGGHNVLMIGPPGAGKTLLARALPGILPHMTIDEALDVTRIYSVADQLPPDMPLIQNRPFRAPHHTISHAGLVGGGNWPHPGEISLAHRGVLFLDELPEFGPRVLEVMRQPIEDKIVTISRAQGSLTFPANFQLVAAMNPCPCGYYGDSLKPCTCSLGHGHQVPEAHLRPAAGSHRHPHRGAARRVREAQRRPAGGALGGDPGAGGGRPPAPAGTVLRWGEAFARGGYRWMPVRLGANASLFPRIQSNADMRPAEVRQFCALDDTCRSLMRTAMSQLQLSARAYHRILKLARTIADLAGSESIGPAHLAEALQYRPRVMMG